MEGFNAPIIKKIESGVEMSRQDKIGTAEESVAERFSEMMDQRYVVKRMVEENGSSFSNPGDRIF